MATPEKLRKLGVHWDNANGRVFIQWMDSRTSGTLSLTPEEFAEFFHHSRMVLLQAGLPLEELEL